ncbi:MAG: hypothetical protein HYR60_26240 [Acidobacteria bacterium]|nr:hypothetical protein [Acidobacteriota bacterium]
MLALAAGTSLRGQEQDKDEPEEKEEKQHKGLRFRMKNHPSLRFGNVLRIDFRSKFQLDFRDFNPSQRSHDEQLFELHRGRLGIQGNFMKKFEYEVEYDLCKQKGDILCGDEIDNHWRDVYVNFRHFRRFQIQAGRFKIPFGLEQMTGPTRIDFALRSRPSKYLAPARDTGIMLHGRFLHRGLNYQAGLFKNDGDNARDDENQPTGQRTFAGRLTATPLRPLKVPGVLKTLEIGQSFTESAVPEGLSGLRGKTFAKKVFFRHSNVRGHRLRLGSEMQWTPGPFGLKGEFMHVREQRFGQGLGGEDLPDQIERGWYVSGSWVVTGEAKAGGVRPRRDFLLGHGFGAWELAGRLEQLRFGSSEHPGRPSRSIRAANILPNSDRAWTFGVNWYLNRFLKVQLNGAHEKLEDLFRAPYPGYQVYWVKLLRIQAVL